MLRSLSLVMIGALIAPGIADAQSSNGDGRTYFTVRIQNVSTTSTLKLSNHTTAPAPTAPVLWLVHTNRNPIFTNDAPDRGQGLESLAEDGDPSKLATFLKTASGVATTGSVAVPKGETEPGPLLPGKMYEFSFSAELGQQLTIAMMFGQSNDWFYAPTGEGIALFDQDEYPITGDITSKLILWNAGTEVDEEPGLGPNQAPRQMGPNTGRAEHGKVGRVVSQFAYPNVQDVVRVTIEVASPTR